MAKFTIYNPSGDALYEGTPTYSGSYMEPGQLVFRNVAVPYSIDFPVGCYVDYSLVEGEVETRTGNRYKIYTVPTVTKQARQGTVGDAIVYDNIVLYDAAKSLEFCPFRDIVQGDNNVHYSTQESWSTYEAVEGIRKRIQAVVDSMFPNTWSIQLATRTQAYQIYLNSGRSAEDAGTLADEYEALVEDAREFTFSGGSVLDALKRIYDVWKEVGWRYSRGVVPQVGMREIIFIGPGGGGNPVQYLYGKGNGLKSLKRTIANESELCNRIYPLGNTTNVSPDWYRRQDFAYKESADIQNLLPPIEDWGTIEIDEEDEPTPLKAYYEDAASIARNGLRPKYVYFDGSDDREDIYPTIKGITIGDIRSYIAGGGTIDYPPGASWSGNSAPIDVLLNIMPDGSSTGSTFDPGTTGEDGKASIVNGKFNSNGDASETISTSQGDHTASYSLGETTINVSSTINKATLLISFSAIQVRLKYEALLVNHISSSLVVKVTYEQNGSEIMEERRIDIPRESRREAYLFIQGYQLEVELGKVDGSSVLEVAYEIEYSYNIPNALVTQNGLTIRRYVDSNNGLTFTLLKSFAVDIPPFGFDLTDIVSTEGTVKIMMTSGKCAGREFVVTACKILGGSTNNLQLTLNRQYDESLSTYFPNYTYRVARNDTFVVLGIAMPDFYVVTAASRLAEAARKYLALYSHETWQYLPEIDSKFMQERHRSLIPGNFMKIVDPDIVAEEGEDGKIYLIDNNEKYVLTSRDQYIILNDGTGGVATYVIIDSVSIDESGELPSWKVSLRNRKYVPKYQTTTITHLGRKQGGLIIMR